MEEPTEAIGVERLSAAEGLQVCGESRVTTVQGGPGGMRNAGEAARPTVSDGARGGRSETKPTDRGTEMG